jgi:YihY family inner membrane protein
MSILSTPGSVARSLLPQRTLWARWSPSLRYLLATEVHVYSFAIAANVLLSFVPFCVLLLVLCKSMHSAAAYDAVLRMLNDNLPYFDPQNPHSDFLTRNMQILAQSRKSGVISVILLLFTCNGALLPVEVALNRIWRIPTNRSWLMNQVVSFGLAFLCGSLAFLSVIIAGAHLAAVQGHLGDGLFAKAITWLGLKLVALPVTISTFFLLYYILPNGKVPARPMFRAAVFAGLLTEVVRYIYQWSLPWLDFKAAYGPFSVSVTILFWAFCASMILLMGAHASATPAATQGGA